MIGHDMQEKDSESRKSMNKTRKQGSRCQERPQNIGPHTEAHRQN
jgi:hypothetical protein